MLPMLLLLLFLGCRTKTPSSSSSSRHHPVRHLGAEGGDENGPVAEHVSRVDSDSVGEDSPTSENTQRPTVSVQSVVVFGGAAESETSLRVLILANGLLHPRLRSVEATPNSVRREILELTSTRLDPAIPMSLAVGKAGLRRIVREPQAAGLAFELDSGTRLSWVPLGDRIVVDIHRPRFQARSQAGTEAPALRTVVLDPGHGGPRGGAHYEELWESVVAYDLAVRVARELNRVVPALRVILTRGADEDVSLEERTAIANGLDADVFVSIHLNASDAPIRHGGVTTFVLDTSNDRQALRLAARENGTQTGRVTELQHLFATIHRTEQVLHARRLADWIQRFTLEGARQRLPGLVDRGVKTAMFHVLVGAQMPAVLVEASFLSQPGEGEALRSNAYRQNLAQGIAQGILYYGREWLPE